MNRRIILTWVVALCGGAALLGLVLPGYLQARARAAWSTHELHRVTTMANELAALRSSLSVTGSEPNAPALMESLSAVIARCGLPAQTLASLAPEQERPITGVGGAVLATRKRATLTLAGLTLPQVGGFLTTWRETQPRWVVASLELAPSTSDTRAGGDLPLRVGLTLETVELLGGEQ